MSVMFDSGHGNYAKRKVLRVGRLGKRFSCERFGPSFSARRQLGVLSLRLIGESLFKDANLSEFLVPAVEECFLRNL